MNANTGKAQSTTAISREENWAMDTTHDLHHNRKVGTGVPASDSTVTVGVENTEEVVARYEKRRSSKVARTWPLLRIEATESSSSVPARGEMGGGSTQRGRLPVPVARGWMPRN